MYNYYICDNIRHLAAKDFLFPFRIYVSFIADLMFAGQMKHKHHGCTYLDQM